MKIKRLVMLALCLVFLVGCRNVTTPLLTSGTSITECDAIKIAKEQVPARIAEDYTNSGFRQELGPHGTWFVNFANVYTTPGEMGWVENENTHFIPGDNPLGEQDLPPGSYRNVVIYVDSTGSVTGRELNNGIILGPLPHECDSESQDQTSIIYSGLTISDEIDKSWQKSDVSEIESLLGQKLPMPTYLPSGYEIKEAYYFQEPNSNPQVTDILILISDQPISWVGNEYTCRVTFSIGWNSPGLGLKLPTAENIPEINGKLEKKDDHNVLWWESYGSPGSLGSTLKLTANQQFSKDELIKIAASTRANSN